LPPAKESEESPHTEGDDPTGSATRPPPPIPAEPADLGLEIKPPLIPSFDDKAKTPAGEPEAPAENQAPSDAVDVATSVPEESEKEETVPTGESNLAKSTEAASEAATETASEAAAEEGAVEAASESNIVEAEAF